MFKLPHIKLKQNPHLFDDSNEKEANNLHQFTKEISKLNETITNFCSFFSAHPNLKPSSHHLYSNQSQQQTQAPKGRSENWVIKDQQIQQRYRCIDMEVELIGNSEDRQYKIKRFLVHVVNSVTSKGFYYFEKHVFNEEKFRFFCCRNILYKIIQFAKLNNLSLDELEMVDFHLQYKVLPFAKANYPKSETKGTNLKLAKMVGNLNNINSNVNDLVYKSGIKFRKKQSGDYTPEILTFINYLIDLTKQKGQGNQETLFMMFYKDMDDFFTKIQSQYWMMNARDGNFNTTSEIQEKYYGSLGEPEKTKKQRQKYREKVKQYTKYAIGKKIPENIKKFTDEQIYEQIPELEHPAIMRIITKWIEQLEEWFETKENIMNREEMFRMRDGTENYIAYSERYRLQQYLIIQKKNLDVFIENVKKNNSLNHFNTLRENGTKIFKEFVRDQESECGYFSTLINKCYSNYLINYLNKLLDCILAAESEWALSSNRLQENQATIPTLITFRVGDLLRCKCSSKQSQIISLFSYLKHLSGEAEQNMEIIRVKNRLNQGTKDILINIRYRNQILVEMQLSIDGDKSYFIQCSEKANHFLYQLERANFGPIAEICNVWLNSSPQSTVLKSAFDQNNVRKQNVKKLECRHQMQKENLPFRCSFCTQFCSNLTNVTPNRKCMKCNIYICSKCFVEMGKQQGVTPPEISREDFLLSLNRNALIREIIVVDLNKKNIKEKNYIIAEIKNKQFIFEVFGENESINSRLLKQFKSKKQCVSFFQNKLVIKYHELKNKSSYYKSLQQEVFRQYIKSTKKDQKKMFTNEQSLFFQDIIKNESMPSVERINFYCNNLNQLGMLPTIFSGCKLAYLSNNNISNLEQISKWKTLQALYLDKNNLQTLPKAIGELNLLKLLNLSKNKIIIINPELKPMPRLQTLYLEMNEIYNLQSIVNNFAGLKICYLNTNKIIRIPPQIGKMKNLVHLDLGNNQISIVPSQMSELENLEILAMELNGVEELPPKLFQNMRKLKQLWVFDNKLKVLPSSIKNCLNLQKIYCENNKLVQWPQIFDIKTLKVLTVSNNVELKRIPRQIQRLENLQQFWAQQIGLDELPSELGKLSKLNILILSNNNLTEIPQQFVNLRQLREFYLDNNKLTRMHACLIHMESIEKYSMENNPLTFTPTWISTLKNLNQLNVYTPALQKIYPDILSCPNLRVLRVCSKNLNQSSLQILNQLRKSVVLIQHSNQSQESDEQFEGEFGEGQGKPRIKRMLSVSEVVRP